MVRVAVDVPLYRLFHDVQVVRGIEVARSGVSETNKSAVNDFLSLSVKIPIVFEKIMLLIIRFRGDRNQIFMRDYFPCPRIRWERGR